MNIRRFAGRAWRNLNRRVSRIWLDVFSRKASHPMVRLGSDGNGWFVPADMPPNALCYCVGVGLDASFDFELAERGADVYSFDPTPPAIRYMERENSDRTKFHPWGLLDKDSTMRLYFPMSETHGSYFIEDLHGTGRYHEVPCLRMSTILERLGHGCPYLVKMDIEGSWGRALEDMMRSGHHPEFLEVEFDSPAPVWKVSNTARLLERSGYGLVLREGDNAVYKRLAA